MAKHLDSDNEPKFANDYTQYDEGNDFNYYWERGISFLSNWGPWALAIVAIVCFLYWEGYL